MYKDNGIEPDGRSWSKENSNLQTLSWLQKRENKRRVLWSLQPQRETPLARVDSPRAAWPGRNGSFEKKKRENKRRVLWSQPNQDDLQLTKDAILCIDRTPAHSNSSKPIERTDVTIPYTTVTGQRDDKRAGREDTARTLRKREKMTRTERRRKMRESRKETKDKKRKKTSEGWETNKRRKGPRMTEIYKK